MKPLTIAKFVGIGLLVALVLGGAFMLRHELIEKGRNLVYAEDNAALVKAQKAQLANDAKLVVDQKAYIDHLERSGTTVKESIRVVKAPCEKDGAGDPRLGDVVDWLYQRRAADSLPAGDRRPAEGAVSPPRSAAPAR